jgi:hypothetical protein
MVLQLPAKLELIFLISVILQLDQWENVLLRSAVFPANSSSGLLGKSCKA